MRRLVLPGHYGRSVEIDLCAACHLVWFDLTETARLSGPAMLEVIGTMAASQSLPHRLLRDDAHCARCSERLRTVHNRSRWGQSLQLECRKRHGAYQSFAQFLQEKGLLRPMSRIDRAQLLERAGRIDCVNCGAAVGKGDETCTYCRSVPSLLDVARLAHALDPEGALATQAVHHRQAQIEALHCAACGMALPPGQSLGCPQCGATLAISRLAEAHEHVATLGPALKANALRPAPALVKRRLATLDADLPRRRAFVQQLEAEAQEMRHGNRDWSTSWEGLQSSWLTLETNPLRALLIALVIWFVWWFW